MLSPSVLILAGGVLSALFVGLLYSIREGRQSRHWLLQTVTFTGISGLIPATVFAIFDLQDNHHGYLLWAITPLAVSISLLFVVAHDGELTFGQYVGQRGLRLWILILIVSVVAYGIFFKRENLDLYCWLSVFLGMLVGASEIISRYRDEPLIALLSLPGLIYLAINGAIAAAALGLLRYYTDEIFPGLKDDELLMSILAGFGAMVVMRSKLFSFKTTGGEEFAVGPDAVITLFLRSVDRAIDRWRSISRQQLVFRTTQNILYSRRVPQFFTSSIQAYQNLTDEEKGDLRGVVEEFDQRQDLDPQLKLMGIAFGFLNVSGEGNYTALMADLNEFLQSAQPQGQQSTTPGPTAPGPTAPEQPAAEELPPEEPPGRNVGP